MTAKSIVWLASYPKSGNTWLRMFLANYLMNREEPLPLNDVAKLGFGDANPALYARVAKRPIDPSDHRACLALRPRVLAAITANRADVNLVKTHNARTTAFGTELVPAAVTRAAIYIVRHPLDMALSYARHYAMTVEHVVEAIQRDDHVITGDRGSVPQYLGAWATHVRSWTRPRDFPVLTLRYEDLLDDPATGFARALRHLGLPVEDERLARAVRFSSFGELKAQEETTGFVEQSANGVSFFNQGKAGQWRERLDPGLADGFIAANRRALDARGYAA